MRWIDRLVMAAIAGAALIAGCSKTPTGTPADDASTIELERVVNEDFGISSLVPRGWQEYLSGRFRRGGSPQTELIAEFYPRMDAGWLVASLVLPALNISELPAPVGGHQTDHLTWDLYTVQSGVGAGRVDLAISEVPEGVYRVMMSAAANEYAVLHDQVFLPVVDALQAVDTNDPNVSYQDGLRLFDYDPGAPLDLQVLDSTHNGNVSELTISYASPKGGRVPGVILVPDGPGPFPGLVFMHSMPGTHENIYGLGLVYAENGSVAILIDAPHGRPENRGRPEGPLTYTEQDRDEQIQLIVDLRRAVDVLVSRPDVDPARMAYLGASYGGGMGGLLAGVETRLVAYVLIVGGGGLVEHTTGFLNPVDVPASWIEAMWPIEPLHYVGHAAPAALLYQSALGDRAVAIAEAVRYQRAGSDPKRIMWYDTDHWLNDQAWQDQREWLRPFIEAGSVGSR